MRPLRVLLTNITLGGRTGTEIVTRDLALGLRREGHRPLVYSPRLGPLADELRRASVPVTDSIGALGEPPDIIHGHHNPTTATAIARFPQVPAIFVGHDFVEWHDAPPRFPSIRRYVAVDCAVAERLALEAGVPVERIAIHLNAVDLERFPAPDRALPERPARALAFVKNLAHLDAVRAACETREVALDVAGTMTGRTVDAPERLLPQYDLVFATALSALEAMVSGCAVIVCDARGLAGFVDPVAFESARPYNFGLRTLTRRATVGNLVAEIDRYDAGAARRVTQAARGEADMNALVRDYLALYRACIAEARADGPDDAQAYDAAVARHIERWSPRYGPEWPWMVEREELRRALDEAHMRPPRLEPGVPLRFASDAAQTVEYAGGFSVPEDWGVWTEGERAVLAVRVDGDAPSVNLALTATAFVPPEQPQLTVEVHANEGPLDVWTFRNGEEVTTRVIRVPVGPSGLVVLAFGIGAPRSPLELGLGNDPRRLGLGLIELELRGEDHAES